jgi:FAD/FMN-containing dehydrogenase
MGLTGVILRAAIRLRAVETGWIRQRLQPAPDLESAVAALRTADDSTYSVAWIDCLARGKRLGRSLVMSGEHAGAEELTASAAGDPFAMTPRRTLKVPVTPPGWLLNGLSVRAFNALYYRRGVLARGDSLVDWDQYFYPLDAILGWNRIYGRRGFVQHQCVLPPDTAIEGLRAMLETIGDAGIGSFLAVLKKLGPAEGHFAFPMAGYTLALDFPMRRTTPPLLEKLDRLVIEHGGRLYLAKDASMSAETLHAMDPRAEDFARWRAQQGLSERFQSMQSERLSL